MVSSIPSFMRWFAGDCPPHDRARSALRSAEVIRRLRAPTLRLQPGPLDGDLVRGWELGDLGRIRWDGLTSTRIALLDAGFERRVWAAPQVMSALLARAQRTTQSLLATVLLVGSPLVEERILLLFELFARRWGQPGPNGIRLELPLTHALIARLVAARRPTVTVTLQSLQEQGRVVRESRRSWLVRPIRSAV